MAEWSPWQTLEALRRDIDRVFDENGSRRVPSARAAFLPGRAARRYPLINLYEDNEAVYVEALAPGIDPSSLHLHVQGNTLSMTGRNDGWLGTSHRKPSIGANGPRARLCDICSCLLQSTRTKSRRSIRMGCSP